MVEILFKDADGEELREGFYLRNKDDLVYYIGKIVNSKSEGRKIGFVALSEQFPKAYIVPEDTSVKRYEIFSKDFSQIEEGDSRLRRKRVKEMRKTLKERLAEA